MSLQYEFAILCVLFVRSRYLSETDVDKKISWASQNLSHNESWYFKINYIKVAKMQPAFNVNISYMQKQLFFCCIISWHVPMTFGFLRQKTSYHVSHYAHDEGRLGTTTFYHWLQTGATYSPGLPQRYYRNHQPVASSTIALKPRNTGGRGVARGWVWYLVAFIIQYRNRSSAHREENFSSAKLWLIHFLFL